MLHVSIKPEVIFNFLGVPVTNSLIASLLLTIIFLFVGIYFSMNASSNSSIVFFIRFILIKLHDAFEPILGKLTGSAFPFIASLFLFILLSNWLGLLPGFGSITLATEEEAKYAEEVVEEVEYEVESELAEINDHGAGEAADENDAEEKDDEEYDEAVIGMVDEDSHGESEGKGDEEHHVVATPIFRGATADLNMTLILAIFAFFVIQYYGFKELGGAYLSKFINFKGPIDFFTGILEIISEFSKIISFAFRLFGNIFAGEVLLAVVAFLVPVLASFPFLLLEVFVGFIQAVVFAMLTSVFINVATAEHH